MSTIRLDTSDFVVWLSPDGRVQMQVDGETESVTLDMDPGVSSDMFLALSDPQPEE